LDFCVICALHIATMSQKSSVVQVTQIVQSDLNPDRYQLLLVDAQMPLYGESSLKDSGHETGLWLIDKGDAAFPSFIPCDEKTKAYLKEALNSAGEPECDPKLKVMDNLPIIVISTPVNVKRGPDDLRQENLDDLIEGIPVPPEESERKKSPGDTDFQKILFSVYEYYIKEKKVTFSVDCSRFPELTKSIVGFPTQCMTWPQE
jgi:hypothetical protein